MRFQDKVLFAAGGGSGLAAASTACRSPAEGGRVADLDRAQAGGSSFFTASVLVPDGGVTAI